MNPDEVLAHLPPESEDELTLVDDLPALPLDAFRAYELSCPAAWSQLAPRYIGLDAGRSVDAWCFAGLLFARAGSESVAFGRIGFLRLPLTPEDLEEHARWPEPTAEPRRAALALAVLLGLRPILDDAELNALIASESVDRAAGTRFAEAWRAPYLAEDELAFFGAASLGGPIHLVRANLTTRWLELEDTGASWLPGRVQDDDRLLINRIWDPNTPPHNLPPDAFADATEPLQSEDETIPEGDETEIT